MNSAFMLYVEHTAKLTQIANKQTMFLIQVLFYAEFDIDSKQYIVDLSVARKLDILKKIGTTSSASTNMANQYLAKISKAGLLKSIGNGRWLVDPKGFSGYKYIPKKWRDRNAAIYETRVFTENGVETKAYVVDEQGVKHDL